MTKYELLGNMSDEEKFDASVSDFVVKCNSLHVALSVSVYQSYLFSHNQSQEILKLCYFLDEFQKKAKKWRFYGTKDQLEFDI